MSSKNFTKIKSLGCIVVSLYTFVFPALAKDSRSINLQEALSQALAQSLAAKQSALGLEQARLNAQMVDYAGDPLLSLNGAWGLRWQKRIDSSPANFDEQSRIHSYSAQMRYTILDFGRQNAKESAATSSIILQELSKEEVDDKIFWSVLRAYQDVVATERIVSITREQQTISQERLAQQTRNYKQGLRPESDVVTAEVDTGKARIALQTALNQSLLAKQTLAQLLQPDTPAPDLDFTVVKGQVSTSEPRSWETLKKEIESFSTQPVAAIKVLQATRESLQAEEKALDATTKPILGTVIAGEYAGENGKWSPMRPSASGQLQLSWDVPWNGMNRTARTSLSLKKQDLELKEKSLTNALDQKVQFAQTLITQTKDLYATSQAQLKLVEKQFKFVQNRYNAGQASALDLSAAEAAVVNMRLDQIKLSNSVAGAIIMFAEARGVRSIEILSKL